MIVAGMFSFKHGREIIESQYASELAEINQVINSVDASAHKVKASYEKTMSGRVLFSPTSLNSAFAAEFAARQWQKHRESCSYTTAYYVPGYQPSTTIHSAYREMDFVKNKVGVEVQFGKYAFMVYNVCAKMTIFHNLGVIDVGVEIVPVKDFAAEMSTGVSYFEQFVWDLEHRGEADIDIPVLILGVAV